MNNRSHQRKRVNRTLEAIAKVSTLGNGLSCLLGLEFNRGNRNEMRVLLYRGYLDISIILGRHHGYLPTTQSIENIAGHE